MLEQRSLRTWLWYLLPFLRQSKREDVRIQDEKPIRRKQITLMNLKWALLYVSESWSKMGFSCLQGAHHSAQKLQTSKVSFFPRSSNSWADCRSIVGILFNWDPKRDFYGREKGLLVHEKGGYCRREGRSFKRRVAFFWWVADTPEALRGVMIFGQSTKIGLKWAWCCWAIRSSITRATYAIPLVRLLQFWKRR